MPAKLAKSIQSQNGKKARATYKKKAIHHGQPISIVNLKSNTMKNTMQI